MKVPPGAALVAVLAVTSARAAYAEPSRVVLVRDHGADGAVVRAELRVAAELRAYGFEVEEVMVEDAGDARSVVERGGESAPFATILLRHEGRSTTIDVWIADRLTNKTVVRRVESNGSGDSAERALALRVVELMRASLVESVVLAPTDESSPAPKLPPDVARWTRQAVLESVPGPHSLAVSVGATGAFAGPELGVAAAPQLRVSQRLGGAWSVGALAVGPAFGARLTGAEGTATVRQELALAEAMLELRTRGPLSILLAIGLGAYHVDARGNASAGFVGGHADAWSALASAGALGLLRVSSDVSFGVDGRALAAFPRPVIAFGTQQIASLMRPGVLGGLALVVDLR